MADEQREYELTFDVSGLTEEADDTLSRDFDVLSGVDHDGRESVTLAVSAESAIEAARRAARRMNELRLVVHRLREDLVTRKDIAQRAGVTPQAVGAWIRRERRPGDLPFPDPFNPVSGGVYLWGEVNEWLRQSGHQSDDWEFPTREDYVLINADLHDWLAIQTSEARVPVSVRQGVLVVVAGTATLRNTSTDVWQDVTVFFRQANPDVIPAFSRHGLTSPLERWALRSASQRRHIKEIPAPEKDETDVHNHGASL